LRHVTDEEIGLFLSGCLQRASFRRVLVHLVDGCSMCRARVAQFDYLSETRPGTLPFPEIDSRYDGALKRARAKALDETPRWYEEHRRLKQIIEAGASGIEGLLKQLDDHLGGWPLVEALIELSREARFREPQKMLKLALAAFGAAHGLDRRRYTPGVIRDFQGAAWAELGNAYRVNEDYACAEDAFAQARSALDEGTGDPIALARLLDLRASLRTAQRRLSEAIELLDTVSRLYSSVGENHLAGRALISKGITIRYDDKPREAIEFLRQGMEMLDPGRDSQLMAIGQQNLLLALVDSGEFREAQRRLLASGLRQRFAAEPINLLRLRWVEGRIHSGLGKLWRADAIFQEVREGFHRQKLEFEAAMVGLELSEIWLRQGRAAEVRKLASEILDIVEELSLEQEALRAVRYLEEACRRDEATPDLVQRVLQFLRRLEWEPQLQFAT
jgi:tetratricopeptide (TPR) repeat protein